MLWVFIKSAVPNLQKEWIQLGRDRMLGEHQYNMILTCYANTSRIQGNSGKKIILYVVIIYFYYSASLKGTLILTPLLGTTWVFGYMTMTGATIVFQYLFVICNSLQGFFIFLVYCATNKEVIPFYRQYNYCTEITC